MSFNNSCVDENQLGMLKSDLEQRQLLIRSKTFADTCDFVICHAYVDLNNLQKPKKTPKRIFVTGEYHVFEQALKLLMSFDEKYELVYHRSDAPFDVYKFEVIRPYVTRIWAENAEVNHPIIQKLPIGFDDKNTPIRLNKPKDILVYVNLGLYNEYELKFAMARHIRQRVYDYFRNKPWAVVDETPIPYAEFNDKLNRSQFVACPMGFGIDTMRFYEAAWVGATPIITSSPIDDVHREFHPLIVDSFEDVTENMLLSYNRRIAEDELFMVDRWIN